MTLYLCFSRWPIIWFSTYSDYSALVVALIAFVLAVNYLPLEKNKKLLIAILGAPIVLLLLFGFTFIFVGAFFGEWL